jgi:hypothetical protein
LIIERDPQLHEAKKGKDMKRGLLAVYGLSVYAIFLGAFAVFIGFIENLGLPRSIDVGPERSLSCAESASWHAGAAPAESMVNCLAGAG